MADLYDWPRACNFVVSLVDLLSYSRGVLSCYICKCWDSDPVTVFMDEDTK